MSELQGRVKWCGDMTFLATSGSGHHLVLDGADEKKAAGPMEAILLALGSCSSVDVVSILKKARQKVQDVEVEVTGTRADSTPAVFTKIHLNFIVTGTDIQAQHVERAVNLSAEKYCSVALMLAGSVSITHGYQVVDQ